MTKLTGEQGDPEYFFGQLNLHLIRLPAAEVLGYPAGRRGDWYEQAFLKSRIEKAQVSKYSFEQNATPGDENVGLQAQLGYLSDTAASYGSQLRDLTPIDPGSVLTRGSWTRPRVRASSRATNRLPRPSRRPSSSASSLRRRRTSSLSCPGRSALRAASPRVSGRS